MQIAIMGIAGKMGQEIFKIAEKDCDIADIFTAERITNFEEKNKIFSNADIVIDFTSKNALKEHAKLAKENKTAMVIGTTGFSDVEYKILTELAKTNAILYAANMSVGVNLLLSLVEKTASLIGEEFDIEIFEMHHRYKKDAPSGTAIALGEAAARGRKIESYLPNYELRDGARKSGEIGFSVARGGDVVGEHSVIFATDGEIVTLSHRANNRNIFAKGAILATKWLKDKPAGLYSMQDIFSF